MSSRDRYRSKDLQFYTAKELASNEWGNITSLKEFPTGYVELQHQCDEWMIGGIEELRLMISDLQDTLNKMQEGLIDEQRKEKLTHEDIEKA